MKAKRWLGKEDNSPFFGTATKGEKMQILKATREIHEIGKEMERKKNKFV